ncbi:MAG TPA: response regulator [Planctomycetota bacterium]|nr:response regulator [Planctomycetota bacterium]
MNSTKETVLLVEDEIDVRDMLREMLTDNGYTVLEAGSGPEALAVAEKADYQFDVMLTDVVMPKMNGPELAEEMGKIVPDLRVLYMSGYMDKVIVDRGVLDRDFIFIDKPFSGEAMLRKLREAIERDPDAEADDTVEQQRTR